MIKEIKNNNIEEVLSSDKPVMIMFGSDWCGPCKIATPQVEYLANVYADEFVIAKVRIEENEELAKTYNIMKIPTLLFFKNGEQRDILQGSIRRTVMEEKLNALR